MPVTQLDCVPSVESVYTGSEYNPMRVVAPVRESATQAAWPR